MLALMLPLSTTLLLANLKKSWWGIMVILMVMTLYSLAWSIQNMSALSVSSTSLTDQMSSMLITLSILIAAMMILASNKINVLSQNKPLFLTLNSTLLIFLIMCFSASSMISFYIWFEASLIPTLLIISIWGYQPERIQAGMYLMMYTITASLPMLMMFMNIYQSSASMMINMACMSFPSMINTSLYWLLLITGFIVKLPMFATHLWLPKAHVEAPIAGSMILAAILLKLGGYGLMRIISIFPFNFIPHMALLSVALYGAVITSLICIRQPDMKSLIAYSSVGHMGIMLAGIMTYTSWGMTASLMMMVAHGLCSSALFIMANITYNMTHTRSIYLIKGLLSITPSLSMWWFLLLAVNMAAPPSLNLLSEIMLITSIMSSSTSSMIILAMLSFFTAVYSLNMFAVTQHGQPMMMTNPSISYKQNEMLLLLIHLSPLILIIIKSDSMILWS